MCPRGVMMTVNRDQLLSYRGEDPSGVKGPFLFLYFIVLGLRVLGSCFLWSALKLPLNQIH